MRALKRPLPPAPITLDAPALSPLEMLLGEGGDGRLLLDPANGFNMYGCTRAPRPDALNFSSSTASTISEHAWLRASIVQRRMAEGAAHDALVEEARSELAHHLGLAGTDTAIVFAPSGTDAMLHALALARARLGTPLVSILCASDETGSGVPAAIAGHHFSPGRAAFTGPHIAGLADGVELVALRLRDADGALRPADESDSDVARAVATACRNGKRVLLGTMDCSKLGNRSPSDSCLDEIEAQHGDQVQVVVDACQARLGCGRLRRHLARGRMVLITGSKFFGGPPLSGALLVPGGLALVARAARLPAGLRAYSTASDWPRDWTGPRATLDAKPNPGQFLRWSAALAEMEAWFAIPADARAAALRAFAPRVSRAMAACDEVRPLPWSACGDDDFPAPTIVPFFVRHDGAELSPAACGSLYRALNRDMRPHLPGLGAEEQSLAALPCHIGQPVSVPGFAGARGALRISAGARTLTADNDDLADATARIFGKLRLLLRHFAEVARVA
jgi:selenocysteine lyase/cysteine desulfurase